MDRLQSQPELAVRSAQPSPQPTHAPSTPVPSMCLLDVLAAAQPAADKIARQLLLSCWRGPSAASARLACRQLRNMVDHSVSNVSLAIKTLEERRLWEAGGAPSISRWPRCSYLKIVVGEGAYQDASGGHDTVAARGMAALLAMPFSRGQPAAAAQPSSAQTAVDTAQPTASQQPPSSTAAAAAPQHAAAHPLAEQPSATQHTRGLRANCGCGCLTSCLRAFRPSGNSHTGRRPGCPQPATAATVRPAPDADAQQPTTAAAAAVPAATHAAAVAGGTWPRIHHLRLELHTPVPSGAVPAVLLLLPQLCGLTLRYQLLELDDAGAEQHMHCLYDALSALPRLLCLVLPSGIGMDRLAGLPCSGRLYLLEAQATGYGRPGGSWQAAAAGVGGLRQLNWLLLDIHSSAAPRQDQFRALLCSLPQSLQFLRLVVTGPGFDPNGCCIFAGLQQGHVETLTVHGTYGEVARLEVLADLLRGWPALQQQQWQQPQEQQQLAGRRLKLEHLTLEQRGGAGGAGPLRWLEEGPVAELLQRCPCVDVGELRVQAGVSEAHVLRAMGRLGVPERLVLRCGPAEDARIRLTLRGPVEGGQRLLGAGTGAPTAPPDEQQQQQQQQAAEVDACLGRLVDWLVLRSVEIAQGEGGSEDGREQQLFRHIVAAAQEGLQQFWDNRLRLLDATRAAGGSPGHTGSSGPACAAAVPGDEGRAVGAAAAAGGGEGLDERARMAVVLRLWKELLLPG